MLEKVTGIELKGANFGVETRLQLFSEQSEYNISVLYGKNGAGKKYDIKSV